MKTLRIAQKLENQKGFTLVELMVIIVLLPLLFFATFSSLSMANVVFQTNNVYANLNQSAIQTLRYLSREIGQTSPNTSPNHLTISTTNGNSDVRFQIPVDHDGDGDAVTSSMNPAVEWGVYDIANNKTSGNARLNGWARYYVQSNQLIREVLTNGLASVGGTSTVIANNVQAFTVSKSTNTLTMAITLQSTESSSHGGAARTIQTSMSSRTLLRNAVS
jgi:Tfp pilus assembly protein PilE